MRSRWPVRIVGSAVTAVVRGRVVRVAGERTAVSADKQGAAPADAVAVVVVEPVAPVALAGQCWDFGQKGDLEGMAMVRSHL